MLTDSPKEKTLQHTKHLHVLARNLPHNSACPVAADTKGQLGPLDPLAAGQAITGSSRTSKEEKRRRKRKISADLPLFSGSPTSVYSEFFARQQPPPPRGRDQQKIPLNNNKPNPHKDNWSPLSTEAAQKRARAIL